MTNELCTTKHERLIELSLGSLNYEGNETNYTPATIKESCLNETLTTHNYSPIVWVNNYRQAQNFRHATGFCIDIDGTMSINDAETILKQNDLNYALITTRSHSDAEHRFRIFIPFSNKLYTLHQYQSVAHKIDELLGSKCDSTVFDGARQLFGSPHGSYYSSNWSGHDFDVHPYTGIDLSNVTYGNGDFDDNLMLTCKDGKLIKVGSITNKTPIVCPFHDDHAPSAFIEYNKKSLNWFIHCSKCKKTFWKTKIKPTFEQRSERFWSHSKNIYEAGITNDSFFFKEITEKKYYTLIDTVGKKEQEEAFTWLVKHHHISNLSRIDYISDPTIDKSEYAVDCNQGIIEVRHAAIPVKIQDNQFIENFLNDAFGQYKEFIKKYLAVYAYTNYKKLPTLILVGKRGAGKNIFAEMVGNMYSSISSYWSTERDNFNPELTKKLLIADETVSNDKQSYLSLKRISGQAKHSINEKYTPKYQVKNNVNMIILSNSLLPIFTEREELPTSVNNNQFFVYAMKQVTAQKINAQLADELRDRLGHYVRTVLKRIFDNLDISKYRYSIPVPITPDEQKLFKSSVSTEESLADNFMQDMINRYSDSTPWEYKDFIAAGYVPVDAICKEKAVRTVDKNKIIRNLRERGYLTSDDVKRPAINTKREYVYVMTEKLLNKIKNDCCFQEQSEEQSEKSVETELN